MDEKTYLSEGTNLVTSTRIQIGGQTFALRNVGSVRVDQRRRKWPPFLLMFFALPAFAYAWWAAVAVIGGALGLLWLAFAQRQLVLVTGGGESIALVSTKPAALERLRAAIAQAISVR